MIVRAIERVEIGMASNVEDELMSLAVVAVVVIVAVVFVVLVAVGIFLELVGTSGAEFENFLLEVPCAARVVRGSGYHGLINIFGAIVKIALQMTAVPGDEREIVGLHALDAGIWNLHTVCVAIAGGL